MHAALDRLYGERPGGDPLPRPGSLAAWIERGRELRRRDRRRARARRRTRPSGRWRAGSSGCWSASSPRRPSARPAASSPGCWRPAFGEHEESERPALRARRLGPARRDRPRRPRRRRPRPRPRLQALRRGHPAREVRGGGEAAAAALPARGRRALGSRAGRRPLPPAARDLGAAAARRRPRGGGRRARRLRPLRQRRGRREELRASCSRTRGGGPARSSPGCAPATSAATPGRGAGLRGHDVCPPFCDFAPICRRDRAPQYAEDEEEEER